MADEDQDQYDDGDDSNVVDIRRGFCQVCEVELPDKRFQYCEEHKPKDHKKRPKPTRQKPRVVDPSGSTLSSKQAALDEVERILEDLQGMAIAQVGMFAPVVGGGWAERAEANTRAMLTIAANHPKVLVSILKAAEAEAWWTLGSFGAAMIVAVGIEIGWVAGDGRLSHGFDLADIYEEVQRQQAAIGAQVSTRYRVADEPISPNPGGLAAEL